LNLILTLLKLDIEGLNITVTSGGKSGVKPKGKQRAEGLEILGNASLKLKAGIHYALIGRNGTGKSSEYASRLRSLFNTDSKIRTSMIFYSL
jgi:ABC-type polysaccharide/polyol phosphate transport system ATPase subunit